MEKIHKLTEKTGIMLWKTSSLWQNVLRSSLKKFSLTLNEFILLETILELSRNNKEISQVDVSSACGVDISVVSTVLKILNSKKFIKRKTAYDNRKRILELTPDAITLLNRILPITQALEKKLFEKLGREEINFSNSLRLILGKKIRVKAEK
ncbi:MAG: hypothetical protein CFH21_00825 [Alphaproteobacteria bacterium MarineAlpha5_Bin11]|nr:hypothetical protein [Pelagibacteraceae bacterium]PPR43355.1 MAG: hypothetical protein CFH21_00825 [Alphaproteobacteria bacterium MarineAlpha5_Bin11]PPR52029.1 MAG: hypothetical protein CFH20_00217 [Alphaproteobacteria bacterium MarineAlpha5_Bin10]|tara:strand:+ start:1525 stop:1980 length:456 start_codon:yes stop_codon:yes gene_type:complete